MGWLSDFLKGEKETKTISQVPMKEPWQMDIGKGLADFYQKYKDLYQPGAAYPGMDIMKKPSIYEEQGLEGLQKYIDRPESGIMASLKDVLGGTLRGEYDPFTSKYYEGIRRELGKEREQSIKSLNQLLSKGGLGGTTFRTGKLGDIEQTTFEKISDVLAGLQEQERTRQLGAVTTGMGLEEMEEAMRTGKLSTIMGVGALPRELETVGYADFLRKQEEAVGVPEFGKGLFQYDIPYGIKDFTYETRRPSGLSRVLDYAKGITSAVTGIQDIWDILKQPRGEEA